MVETPPATRLLPSFETPRSARHSVVSAMIAVDIFPDGTLALLVDISESGAAVQGVIPLSPGSRKQLRWTFPGDAVPAEVTAEVVWSEGKVSGLHFKDLPQATRTRITRWIDDCAASSHSLPDSGAVSGETAIFGAPTSLFPDQFDFDAELDTLSHDALAATSAEGAAIAICSHDGFLCRASAGSAPEVGVAIQTRTGLSGHAIRTATPVCCPDAHEDPRVDPQVCRQLNLRAAIIVPVTRAGEVIGVVECFWSAPNAFTDADVQAVSALADSVLALIGPEASTVDPTASMIPDFIGESRDAACACADNGAFSPDGAARLIDIQELLQEDSLRAQMPFRTTVEFDFASQETSEPPALPTIFPVATRDIPDTPLTPAASVWPGGLLILVAVVLLTCTITFLYLWTSSAHNPIKALFS